MTTIAYKDGVMAADRRICVNGKVIGATLKIHTVGDMVAGCSGERSEISPFLRWLESGASKESEPTWGKGEDAGFSAIVVSRVSPSGVDYYWTTKDGVLICDHLEHAYVAIGSGSALAIGAMAHGATAEESVKAAMKHDPYTGGGVDVVTV